MDPWHWLGERGLELDTGKDPRVGSTRNDSSGGGTLSASNNSKGSSLAKLGGTFAPIAIYLAVCLLIFLFLRPRCKRVYAPRTIAALRYPESPIPELPSGWFNWVRPFFKIPDIDVLNHGSIDGFFFLRFLKVLRNICLAGCLIAWPVLFPIHATGGRDSPQLDILTMGNVADPKKLYANVLVAWVLFGFVIYTIIRECIYYVNLRQAYLSSPHYASRISSRTLLITSVPKEYLDEYRLRKLYGDSARRICIPRTSKTLAKLVKEREQTATRLEKAEIELIRKAHASRKKHLKAHPQSTIPPLRPAESADSKKDLVTVQSDTSDGQRPSSRGGHLEVDLPGSTINIGNGFGRFGIPQTTTEGLDQDDEPKNNDEGLEYTHPYGLVDTLPDVRGSVAAQWVPVEDRPHHRPIGNYGRRVDTIRWTRTRLKQLNVQIFKLRRQVRRGDEHVLSAAFIEFDTQEAAQSAQQTLAHHRPLQMSNRLLGIRPDEVLWTSLRIPWWERIMRRFAILALITATIIFFSIPSALIGLISNISFLSSKVFFLTWITKLPKVILGFLEGFLPPLMLSLLMAVVPMYLRWCAAQAGIPDRTRAELFTQNAYFAFQVVQVFLITTLTSGASTAFLDILSDPIGSKDILAQSLPKAANFYLSYILIQCLASGGLGMIQIFGLLRHHVLSRLSAVPRARYKSWRTLQPPRWGAVFPVFTNMGVIALSYAVIAPLVLVFAAGGMAFVRLVWKYNLIYVLDSDKDSKGLFYPQALLHLLVGLYMAQVCLIGLFALNLAIGPLVLMLIFIIFTALVHISLSNAIAPLLQNLPQTLSLEEEFREEEKAAIVRQEAADVRAEEAQVSGAANTYYDPDQIFGDEEDDLQPVRRDTGEVRRDSNAVRRDSNDVRRDTDDEDDDDEATVTNDRALEGASSVKSALAEWLKLSTKSKVQTEADNSGLTSIFHKLTHFTKKPSPDDDPNDPDAPPSYISTWLHPEEYEDFIALRKLIPPDSLPNIQYPDDYKNCDYMPPELWLPKPTLWIPRDEARVSRQEVAHTRLVTPITDRGAEMDEKGRVIVHFDQAPAGDTRLLL